MAQQAVYRSKQGCHSFEQLVLVQVQESFDWIPLEVVELCMYHHLVEACIPHTGVVTVVVAGEVDIQLVHKLMCLLEVGT